MTSANKYSVVFFQWYYYQKFFSAISGHQCQRFQLQPKPRNVMAATPLQLQVLLPVTTHNRIETLKGCSCI